MRENPNSTGELSSLRRSGPLAGVEGIGVPTHTHPRVELLLLRDSDDYRDVWNSMVIGSLLVSKWVVTLGTGRRTLSCVKWSGF